MTVLWSISCRKVKSVLRLYVDNFLLFSHGNCRLRVFSGSGLSRLGLGENSLNTNDCSFKIQREAGYSSIRTNQRWPENGMSARLMPLKTRRIKFLSV